MTVPLTTKLANDAFKQGDYSHALNLYRQLSQRMDPKLFKVNIWLCQKGIVTSMATTTATAQVQQGLLKTQNVTPQNALASAPQSNAMQAQLELTQGLLEYYYDRVRQLEYQLLDQKTE